VQVKQNTKDLFVTSPLMPLLADYAAHLEQIWESKWLTNEGRFHQELECALAEYLGVEHLSLFANGTLPLLASLQAQGVTGEVITTPYSFVATTHSIWWSGLVPVFADVDSSGNLDPARIEEAITPRTTAILPVHVYGNPCQTQAIQEIARPHGLSVIYDAAHAFGVKVNGESILHCGDMATLSFHATKVFTTAEGGALVCRDAQTKQRIDHLRNFGIADETTVVAPGINAKMDELRAAYGLCALPLVDGAIAARRRIARKYRELLSEVEGISFFTEREGVEHNHSYFPVFVNEKEFGMNRDMLYEKLKEQGILGRRYFYPLISEVPAYRSLPSANPKNLPVAHKMAREVLCLPIHAGLGEDDVARVVEAVKDIHKGANP
jgi:dTDP-4-amino-4,6-dideoxygalactose transaminase